jgi:phosphoribosylanthranilate isomerase
MPTRVKICGIGRIEDAETAVEAGVDAIGLVFYEASPRYVDLATAQDIARAVGPFVTVVGLFVDADSEQVNRILETVPLHVLQFHGNESACFCEQFAYPWIKALRIKPDVNLVQLVEEYSSASGILVDSYKPGVPGGTGEVFDWSLLPDKVVHHLILAGGLDSENVSDAIARVKPYAVDVSGGVEVSPGRKDRGKIMEFVDAVGEADKARSD